MNILAHLYLSGNIDDIMLGNYMGDFVKGNKYRDYTKELKEGILLHRQIDTFTDNHISHKDSRDRFREEYGLYSGIVVDIIYDYFLASRWSEYHTDTLEVYSQKVYSYISSNSNKLPDRLQIISKHLIDNNWFRMYSSFDGIRKVLTGMSKRTSLPNNVNFAMETLELHNKSLNNEFSETIADLKKMVAKSSISV